MMTLLEKQQAFASLICTRFIPDLEHRGYAITFGEAYRPKEMAEIYAAQKKGIVQSNHEIRIAIDLNIFYDGHFLTTKDDLTIPGELWKSYSTDEIECCWGGDFSIPDSDHFSVMHNGIK